MSNFTTIPMNQVRLGEMFTPIEKTGEPTWDKRRKRWDKRWIKCPKSYVSTGRLRGVDQEGKDGLFAMGDWAIVRRAESAPRATDSARGVDRLLSKYGARN